MTSLEIRLNVDRKARKRLETQFFWDPTIEIFSESITESIEKLLDFYKFYLL